MRKLWCFEIGKIGEKFLYGISLFLLENKWEGNENFKGKKKETRKDQNAPFAGVPRVAHVAHTWPPSNGILAILASRAPYAFFDRFRPSELRFRIRLWITNRDSHTLDED